ncbi:hypothetical protein C4K13_2774 [Pseudomonas chlororaphis subsp. aureofaciens]|nr:hypothetical protein C4K13_2774 [Pseudomonas chlororaphis subsp. aureofaciens]
MYQIERDHRFYDGYAAERRLRQRLQGDAPVIELPPRRNTKAAAHVAAFFAPGISARSAGARSTDQSLLRQLHNQGVICPM